MKTKKISGLKITLIAVALILVSKLIVQLYFPETNLDGPWSLSYTFSIINGHLFQSSFSHDFGDIYNLPYLYGTVTAAIYFPFAHTWLNIYSIFLINFIFIVFLLFIFYKIFKSYNYKKNTIFIVFAFAIVLSYTFYLQRPEPPILIFIGVLHLVLLKTDTAEKSIRSIVAAGVLTGLIALLHPTAGLYCGYFILIFFYEKKSFKKIIYIYSFALATVIVLYLPVVLLDYNAWKYNLFTRVYSNEDRGANWQNIKTFFTYSVPFLFLMLIYIISISKRKMIYELFVWIILIALIVPLGRYYYFIYLFHFLFWRMLLLPQLNISLWTKCTGAIFFLAGLLHVLLLPVFQVFENRDYVATFKHTIDKSRTIAIENPLNHVWVSPFIGMSVIDLPNGRLHFKEYVISRGRKPSLNNDIFLIENLAMKNYIQSYVNAKTDSLTAENIISPVKGLRRFGFNNSRNDSLGLWKINVIHK